MYVTSNCLLYIFFIIFLFSSTECINEVVQGDIFEKKSFYYVICNWGMVIMWIIIIIVIIIEEKMFFVKGMR